MQQQTDAVKLITYVSLDKSREYHSDSISAFKSGSQYYFCNQAVITAPPTITELVDMKTYLEGHPHSIWTRKGDPALAQSLLTNGFTFMESFALMSANLSSIAPSYIKEGIEVKELTDLQEILTIWAPIVEQAFETPHKELNTFLLYLQQAPIAPNIRYFVAYLNGVPAATNMLIVHENFVAMDWVGTIPTLRGRGLGSVISCNPLHIIKQSGAKEVLLLACHDAQPIYQKIGFKVVDWYDVYLEKNH
jgi:hypothetical protein